MADSNKELLKEIIEQQKIRGESDMQYAANISIIMNRQDDSSKKQEAFNQKISSLLFSDTDTNRKGYIANQDDLNVRVTTLETKNSITAGKVGISVLILSSIGGFFLWGISLIWK